MIPNEPMNDDTIPVRPDELFNEAKLANYLLGKLKGTDKPLRVRQFGGGAANLTYLLDFEGTEYVLRRPPLGPVAKSAHDMGREYKVLSVLYKSFPYAPRAFLYCDDIELIGAPFFIMERKKGIVIRNSFDQRLLHHDANLGYLISEALVDRLVEFHDVDYKKIGLETLGRKPEHFIERQIEGWYHRWQNAKTEEVPDMDAVYLWLNEKCPSTTSISLVHNDYKLDNVMLDSKDPSKIVAIFDWDMCTLGDPLSDLGALLTYWSEPKDPFFRKAISTMPTEDLGFMTREELVKRYAKKSNRSVKDIDFYHILGLFRLTVIIAQIYIRYKRGQTQDQRFAALGSIIPLVAQTAKEIALETYDK
ncbi:MAG: phosphotransferase family protein [Candidatus Hodarchaeales archaeon]|jgi:aminoglycoside phosphotransferase (APT) family kinase protein